VYVALTSQLVAAKVPYDTPVVIGEPVGIRFAASGLLLFDAQTHRRLPFRYQAKA
jgi:hypothetical protein